MRYLILFFILWVASTSAVKADVWIQYDVTTGIEYATNSAKVDDNVLAAIGRAQILYTGNSDPTTMMVDVTQTPPVVIAAPPPPPPPPSEIDLIFNAMVQSGQINPATISPALLARVNASLAVTGAATITVPAQTGASSAR